MFEIWAQESDPAVIRIKLDLIKRKVRCVSELRKSQNMTITTLARSKYKESVCTTLVMVKIIIITIPSQQWHVCHMQGEHRFQLKHDQALALITHHQHLLKPVIIH